jgi:hypothetical protein
MKKTKVPEESLPSLVQIEAEVMAEGREWMRQRLETRMQELADQQSEVFPPKSAAAGPSARLLVRVKHRRGSG